MKRERTKFQGVYQRLHSTRRHMGKPDVCYDITYKDANSKKVWEKVGWISEGYTAQASAVVRSERIRAMRHGDIPAVSRPKVLTLGEGFEVYRKNWLTQIKTAQEDIRRYHAYIEKELGGMPLCAISPLDLERLKASMAGRKYSAQTIRHALGLVRRVYRKLVAWDLYTGSIPTEKISMPRVDAARTRFLTQHEAQLLLNEMGRRSSKWHDITLLSLHTGMRLGEVLSLRWEDIDFGNMHVYVRDAKAGSRTAFLTPEAAACLESRKQESTGLVFPARGDVSKKSVRSSRTFVRAVDTLKFNEGVVDTRQKVVFHTLRHTFASWLALKGVPLYVIGELLGHKTLEMTKRYSHLCPDAKREAMAHISSMVQPTHTSSSCTTEDIAE